MTSGQSVVSALQRFNHLTILTWRSHFPHNLVLVSVLYLSERPEMTSHGAKSKKAKQQRREIKIMNNIKRISLMTAIFLTMALVSSSVEAGVIRINGSIAGSESGAPFPNPAEGIYVNGSVMSTDTALGPFTLFYSLPVDFAFADTPPGNAGGSRLIVGDAANGDSILACFLGRNSGLCANGDLRHVDPWTIIGGTGRYAGARGSFTTDTCSNLVTGETSGTISGTIVIRGR